MASSNVPIMESVGLILNEKYDLPSKRIYFTFDEKMKRSDITDENIRSILPDGLFTSSGKFSEAFGESFIDRITDFPVSHIDMLERNFDSVDYTDLKWHIDDVQVVDRKIIYKNQERYWNIKGNKYLYSSTGTGLCPRRRSGHQRCPSGMIPLYTCVLYFSDFGHDFTGGEFRFVDGTSIKPQRGMGICFDSREVHMVTPVKSGHRESMVVKLY